MEVQHKRVRELHNQRREREHLEADKVRAERMLLQAQEELKSVVQLVNGERFTLGSRCTNSDMLLSVLTNKAGNEAVSVDG